MARMPRSVKVGVHAYKVVADKARIDALSVASGTVEARLGECDTHSLTITIDPTQALTMAQETLLHEVLHACWSLVGASEDINDSTEERLTLRLAPVLLEVLRRNPSLIAYLTDEHTDA